MASSVIEKDHPDYKYMYQNHLIEACTPLFEEFLNPSDILPRLNTLSEFQRFLDVLEDRKVPGIQQTGRQHCGYLVLLLQADTIDYITDPLGLAQEMLQGDYLTERDVELISSAYTNNGRTAACNVLFKKMKGLRSDWPFAFFKAMEKHNALLFEHLEIDPRQKEAIFNTTENEQIQPGEGAEGRAETIQSTQSFASENDGLSNDEKTDSASKASNEDFQMRDYQYELSEVAIRGENTVICAPTGSGKTRVARYIVDKHLNLASGDKRKVVFMAKTTSLVNQQAKDFQRFLTNYHMQHVQGESDLSVQVNLILSHCDILVLTPQILYNHLRDGKIKSLSVFSLLILDECHNTRKGEPYNNLMKMYLKAKQSGEKHLPQIVGLTASLGVEKATTCNDAISNILKLCANLDVSKLSTVIKNKAELDKTVPVPDERFAVLPGNCQDWARKEICSTMEDIEKHLFEANDELKNEDISTILRKRPKEITSQAYGQWVVNIKQSAMELNTQTAEEKSLARTMVVVARQLVVYNAALGIHELVRLRDVLAYLEKKLTENLDKNVHSDVERKLATSYRELKTKLRTDEQNDKNPNLKILQDNLMELRRENGPESLGIIFVQTRATCYALRDWLRHSTNEEMRCLNAEAFTGIGAREDDGGITQSEQNAIIGRFRDGKIKLIIATSVAEEGLDIPECNVVIRYNRIGNDITTVQTRGRSRKWGGVSLLLGSKEIVQREQTNVKRSKMMTEAIQQIQKLPQQDIDLRISQYQREAIKDMEIEEAAKKSMSEEKINAHFILQCATCRELTVDSKHIRILHKMYRVIIDPNFMENVKIGICKISPKIIDGIEEAEKIVCKRCRNYLGRLLKYRGCIFPSIAINSYQCITDGNQVTHYKKWKKCPFLVQGMEVDDYKYMFDQVAEDNEAPFDNDAACKQFDDNEKDIDEASV
ncbi:ATP-dependent RNA helicase DHX58 isoform X2 [Patella vulgata]|uniref:ATP-dependent RNA helicase DHX58 isoform X2 n=1 Tax=Patella vulgata TaxID=6465 RepID=UPI00217FFA64|nr:ATP-dependent RNA helicase DHX58 isoform X2 [Patella vulgata]